MQHMTRDEFKLLLLDKKLKPRQRLMFKVGFWHGLRVSELTSLTGKDIKDGYVACRRLKGSMETFQKFQSHPDPLIDEATELTELARTIGRDERLFPITRFGVDKLMKRIGKRVNLPQHKMHAHVIKHTTAMHSIGEGIEFTRQLLGHRSIASTGAYLRVSDDAATESFSRAMSSW